MKRRLHTSEGKLSFGPAGNLKGVLIVLILTIRKRRFAGLCHVGSAAAIQLWDGSAADR